MALSSITGILSRYFVLGYFVPAFFTLFALSELLTRQLLPDRYQDLKPATQVLVLGAGALFMGLILLGLRYPITRTLEGYPFEHARLAAIRRPLVRLQQRSYDALAAIRDDAAVDTGRRSTTARLLDRRFPRNRNRLLATRFGNAYRASENYSFTRWGLDGIAIWPRIDTFLNEQERDLHTNAASDLAFFVNSTLGAVAAGLALAIDGLLNQPIDGKWWWAYAIPFAVSYIAYRASIGAVERVGTEKRASIDRHRLDLYKSLGVRLPKSFTDEREHLARAVNRWLLYGEEPIPDDFWQESAGR